MDFQPRAGHQRLVTPDRYKPLLDREFLKGELADPAATGQSKNQLRVPFKALFRALARAAADADALPKRAGSRGQGTG